MFWTILCSNLVYYCRWLKSACLVGGCWRRRTALLQQQTVSEPERRLSLRSKSCNWVNSPSRIGTVPFKPLPEKSRDLSCFISPSSDGISPVKELEQSDRVSSQVSTPSWLGREPDSWFSPKDSIFRRLRLETWGEGWPKRRFWERLRTLSLERSKSKGETGPLSDWVRRTW